MKNEKLDFQQIVLCIILFLFLMPCVLNVLNSRNVPEKIGNSDIKVISQSSPQQSGYWDEIYDYYFNSLYINESTIANYAISGTGKSWDDPYTINDLTLPISLYDSFQFQNISDYVVIQNLGMNFKWTAFMQIINSQHFRIENSITYNNDTFYGPILPQFLILNSSNIEFNNLTSYHNRLIIQIENCQKITLENVKLIDNAYYYRKSTKLYILDSENVNIYNSLIDINQKGLYADYITYFENLHNSEIIGNNFSQTEIYCIGTNVLIKENTIRFFTGIGDNFQILDNKLFGIGFSDTDNVTIRNNELNSNGWEYRFSGYLQIHSYKAIIMLLRSSNIEILGNDIQGADIGVWFEDSLNFTISYNKFSNIKNYIFYFNRFSIDFEPEIVNPIGKITLNRIYTKSFLHNDIEFHVRISWNLIYPNIAIFIVFGLTIFWFSRYWPYLFRYYKQSIKHSKVIKELLKKKEIFVDLEDDLISSNLVHEYLDNMQLLNSREMGRFKKYSFSILFLVVLYLLITLMIMDRNFDIIHLNTNPIVHFILMSFEFIIIGLYFNGLINQNIKYMNIDAKIFKNIQVNTEKIREKKHFVIICCIILVFELWLFDFIIKDKFRVVIFVLGLISLIFFIISLLLKLRKQKYSIYFEFLILGSILIYAYLSLTKFLNSYSNYDLFLEIGKKTQYFLANEISTRYFGIFFIIFLTIWICGLILTRGDNLREVINWEMVNQRIVQQRKYRRGF